MVFEEAVVTHGIEATCASPNGIEAKCASPRWRPNPEIDWHRDRYPRDMINPAGRNHVIRQRSPSSNAINYELSAPIRSFFSLTKLSRKAANLWDKLGHRQSELKRQIWKMAAIFFSLKVAEAIMPFVDKSCHFSDT